jgi:photosystem II stability/assembly factor-like uncharacterized protein
MFPRTNMVILALTSLVSCGGQKPSQTSESPKEPLKPSSSSSPAATLAPVSTSAPTLIESPSPDSLPDSLKIVAGLPSWQVQNPRFHGPNLSGVWGSSKNDIFAVGENGTILHSKDEGNTWTPQNSGTTANLHKIWGSSKRDIFVIGQTGTILHSSDSGSTWTPQISDTTASFTVIQGNGKSIYLLGDDQIFHTNNSGKTWKRLDSVQPALAHVDKIVEKELKDDKYISVGAARVYNISDNGDGNITAQGIVPGDMECGRVGGGDCGSANFSFTLESADSGKSWTSSVDSLQDAEKQSFEEPNTVDIPDHSGAEAYNLTDHWSDGEGYQIVVGDIGVIVHTDAEGTWVPYQSASDNDLNTVWGSAYNDIFIAGDHGTILHSADWGSTWTAQHSGSRESLSGIWGSGMNDVFVVGEKGSILHSNDSGKTWLSQNSNTTITLNAVWGSAYNDVFIVGGDGTILHSTDSGQSWTPQQSNASTSLNAIWGSGKDDIYVAGSGGVILHSTDSGQSWTSQKSGGIVNLSTILGSSQKNDIYIAGDKALLHSTDSGATWTKTVSPQERSWGKVWASGKEDIIAIEYSGLFRSVDEGRNWIRSPLDSDALNDAMWGKDYRGSHYVFSLRNVWGSTKGDIFLVGRGGLIVHYQYSSGPRFVDNQDGTITDFATGLMWAAKDNGADITWSDANTYCKGFHAGDYSDWRMPSSDELQALYDPNSSYVPKDECGGAKVPLQLTEMIHVSCTAVWGAEMMSKDGNQIWSQKKQQDYLARGGSLEIIALDAPRASTVGFTKLRGGKVQWPNQPTTKNQRALPVRNLQAPGQTLSAPTTEPTASAPASAPIVPASAPIIPTSTSAPAPKATSAPVSPTSAP